jgi:hypothetical protein
MKHSFLLLMALGFALSACSFDQGAEGDECPDDAACAPIATVPGVEHTELREAHQALLDAGFDVRFSPSLPLRRGLEDYVVNDGSNIQPVPWVEDIDPEPGSSLEEGATVTITEIECPERAENCL